MSEDNLKVVVVSREDQADEVSVFTLQRPDAKPLPAFEAGAHIDVYVTDDLVRQYSLSNDPANRDSYRIGVLKDPQSRGGSAALHEKLQAGDELQISSPRNLFPLAANAKRTLLVGGGIGITPMVAMAYELRRAGQEFELHYCCRTRSAAGYLGELAREFGDNLHLHFDDAGDNQLFKPEVSMSDVGTADHVYVCGPTGFMDWVKDSAENQGYSKDNIHFEYFSAEISQEGPSFEVFAKASNVTVTVNEGESIADALKARGVKVKVSCEQGVCGTCISDVLEGIPDHQDQFLTEEEREDNDQIALCCSRSKSDRLVIDI